jgi:transcriptional regulator with GAF, ATPase, and Fis domain
MSFFDRIDELKRKLIRGALWKAHGNMAAAGRILGLHRNTVIGYCDRMGIDPSAFERKREARL